MRASRNFSKTFNQASAGRPVHAAPFSLRLTFEERAILERKAGDMPLGAYIRSELLSDRHAPRRTRQKRPVKDHQALAKLLSELGSLRLASNLNQLAKAANSGSLPVTPDTEQALQNACEAVQGLRTLLIQALGLSVAGSLQ